MYKGFVETFMVIIWQGYLRPSGQTSIPIIQFTSVLDMREEVQRLPGDLAPLAKLIYLFLNFSMLFLVINIIILFEQSTTSVRTTSSTNKLYQ